MKRTDKRYLVLVALGALVMSLSFILKHYLVVGDAADGFLKGFSIGLMILSLILMAAKRNKGIAG